MESPLKTRTVMRNENIPKPKFYDMNTNALPSNTFRLKSRTFESLAESTSVKICIRLISSACMYETEHNRV